MADQRTKTAINFPSDAIIEAVDARMLTTVNRAHAANATPEENAACEHCSIADGFAHSESLQRILMKTGLAFGGPQFLMILPVAAKLATFFFGLGLESARAEASSAADIAELQKLYNTPITKGPDTVQ